MSLLQNWIGADVRATKGRERKGQDKTTLVVVQTWVKLLWKYIAAEVEERKKC